MNEREGMPWMPEEDLLILIDDLPPRAVEAFEAIQQLRTAAIEVVTEHATGAATRAAIAALEEVLLAGGLVD